MKSNRTLPNLLALLALAVVVGCGQAIAQQSTAFTYQGQLRDGGTNANGTYTMTFKLYDAVSGGGQIGSTLTTSPTLANGLFSVNLDFGAGAFNGTGRWLDITVTIGGTTQTLSPRVQMLPAPYAQFAATAATVTNNAIMNAQLAANAVTDAKIVSVSGSKISGPVASAVNLTNGSWNTSVGTVQLYGLTFSNIFGINVGTSPVIMMSTNGPFVPNNFHVGAMLALGNSYTTLGYIYYTNTYGVVIGNSVAGYAATITGNLNVAGTVYQSSDRTLKDGFAPIDSQRILERVASLPISNWNFKADATTRHIGPMAQDFYAAFNVGVDDKHISTVDEGGVALAAIQGLIEKMKGKDAKIEAMEKRLADLEELIKSSTHK